MKRNQFGKNIIRMLATAVLTVALCICLGGSGIVKTSGADNFEGMSAAFPLPMNSSEVSPDFARALLKLNMANSAGLIKQIYGMTGFDVVLQKNYDKPANSAAHTSAYTVGLRMQDMGIFVQPVLLVTIRGTSGSEWLSNFDIAPSHLENTEFAENFLYDAEDVLAGLKGVIDGLPQMPGANPESRISPTPIVIVTGFSRGAAAANLLGVLLDEMYPKELVYVYTFATPATVRGSMAERDYPNIFNFLNDRDLVPGLPLEKWGYKRAGTDFVLKNDKADVTITADVLDDSIDKLFDLAPDIVSYYKNKHSLTEKGLSDKGISTFDMMLVIADSLGKADLASGNTALPDMSGFSDETDFAELFDMLAKVTADNNKLGAEILGNHLPTEYQRLLENWEGR